MGDPRVEEAQLWLNEKGEVIPGYDRCEPDGVTGQGTMRSFIMVLQYLLFNNYGYDKPVSGSFGPTTFGFMEQYGDIQAGHYSEYMNNFVRHALWCKGYSGGYVEDAFSEEMEESVALMRQDAGLTAEPVVTPKVMKALLNTDPYTLVNDGDTEIREAQRYLNGKYIDRENFFIGPCGGHTSRGFQKATMKGVQYEMGTPDDQVDGLFGPTTAAGLQTAPFQLTKDNDSNTDDPDRQAIVRLFTAACLMNTGYPGEPSLTPNFSANYTDVLASWVASFQQFSALQQTNGLPDFDTWAQMLVSCGNRDRTYNVHACDLITTITPSRGQALKNADFDVVGRYLHESEDVPADEWLDKEIQPGELDDLFGAGLRCFPIWQYTGRNIDNFTFANGREHGRLAHYHATRHEFDVGTTIYFAVDYDALDWEIKSNILPYFRGVEIGLHEMGNKYHPGVYGARNVCSQVSEAGYARWSFVSGMSWGFSGNLGYPLPGNWTYNQIKEANFDPSDHGESGEPFGLDSDVLRPGGDTGVDHVSTGYTQAEFLDLLGDLYSAIADNGFTPPNGPNDDPLHEEDLIRYYLAAPQYPDSPWPFNDNTGLMAEWLDYARGHFGDPPTHNTFHVAEGLIVSIPKMLASTNVSYGSTSWTYRDKFGWAGDLSRLYSQWRIDRSGYSSGSAFVSANFARLGVDSCFSLPDYTADALGYLLYHISHFTVSRYDEVLESLLAEGVDFLCQQFFAKRWDASQSTLRSSAEAWLVENAADSYEWQQEFLLRYGSSAGGVDVVPQSPVSGEIGDFLDGFAQRVVDLTNSDF